MRLTEVKSWEMGVEAMCTTAAGNIVVRTKKEIQVWGDRMGTTHTTYNKICDKHPYDFKWICEMTAGKYLADLCSGCDEIRVVDMVKRHVYTAYSPSPCSLWAMCSGPGEGSLLVWDYKYGSEAVIQLQWNETTKKLDEVRRVNMPGDTVFYMCYMPHTDLLILIRPYGNMVEAVKLQGGADQPPVWQLQGEVLGKEINPYGVSSDNEGHLYIADGRNSRVLVVNGFTGEVVQELLQDAGLGVVCDVRCMSNPRQILVKHYSNNTWALTLYNITSQ